MKNRVRSDWSRAVLVCGKCSRKLGGGFGGKGRKSLAKALRKETGLGKGRRNPAGIVEVKCLGVCPKGAVTVVDTAEPRCWHLVPAGADVAEVAAMLGLGGQEGAGEGVGSAVPSNHPVVEQPEGER